MAVNIEELQVETQAPAPQQGGAVGQGGGPANADLKTAIREGMKAEIERMQERELRLRTD